MQVQLGPWEPSRSGGVEKSTKARWYSGRPRRIAGGWARRGRVEGAGPARAKARLTLRAASSTVARAWGVGGHCWVLSVILTGVLSAVPWGLN